MFRISYVGLFALLLTAAGHSQAGQVPSGFEVRPITAPVKNAGVFHLATRTWTRAGAASANFGPLVVYNNDASAVGFWADQAPGLSAVDEGQVPTLANTVLPGSQNGYSINGFEIAYCTYNTAGPMFTFQFFGNYEPCTDPLVSSSTGPVSGVLDISGLGLPATGTQGNVACWIVTLDLENTTSTFCLLGDGADGSYDGSDPALDSFGWRFNQLQTNGATDPMSGDPLYDGLLIAGDPLNAPEGDGTSFATGGPGGGGTGLLTQDQFWVIDAGTPTDSGCFWFGGYAGGAPLASFYLQLQADTGNCGQAVGPMGTPYCFTFPNSTGSMASISAFGSTVAADQNTILTTTGVPNSFGIHYFGAGMVSIPFGDGIRCISGLIFRMRTIQASGNQAVQDALLENNNSGMYFAATTWNVQYWFRDPSGPFGTGFNLSNGISITYQ